MKQNRGFKMQKINAVSATSTHRETGVQTSSEVSDESVNSLKNILDRHRTDMGTQIDHQALLHPLLLNVSISVNVTQSFLIDEL
jgi:hypothetical protein